MNFFTFFFLLIWYLHVKNSNYYILTHLPALLPYRAIPDCPEAAG